MDAEDKVEELLIRHDRKWLCEAILNLLDNAMKYSPSKTVITIRAMKMISFLRLEIQDEGIGIPRENYHKVFQRFFRGSQEEVQKEEGAGVGLYLARRIIEEHHGTIFLESRREKSLGISEGIFGADKKGEGQTKEESGLLRKQEKSGTVFVIQLPC